MTGMRVPWVLPIKQGPEFFDGSQGRLPAVVIVTLGLSPGMSRAELARMHDLSDKILSDRRGLLLQFYQKAADAHQAGIVPTTARYMNVPGMQVRYANRSGMETIEITLYPEYFDEKVKREIEEFGWDFLRIDFTWTNPGSDHLYILAPIAQVIKPPLVSKAYTTFGDGTVKWKDVNSDPGPWMGYAHGDVLVMNAVTKLHFPKDTTAANGYAADNMLMALGPHLFEDEGQPNSQSFVIDLRRFPPKLPLQILFNAWWDFSGIDGRNDYPAGLEYTLFKGGLMQFHPGAVVSGASGKGLRNTWQNYTAQATKGPVRLSGAKTVAPLPDNTSDQSAYTGDRYGEVKWDGVGSASFSD